VNVNINGSWVSPTSYQRARASVASMQEDGGRMSANDVLSSLQQMMPNWNISNNTSAFNGTGIRNIGIHPNVLRKMADDPEEMVRFKALVLDGEYTVPQHENWARQNGFEITGRGTIIDRDGNVSSWVMGRGGGRGDERRSLLELPEEDRPSWTELMRQQLESLRENNENEARRLEDEGSTMSWRV